MPKKQKTSLVDEFAKQIIDNQEGQVACDIEEFADEIRVMLWKIIDDFVKKQKPRMEDDDYVRFKDEMEGLYEMIDDGFENIKSKKWAT